MAEELCYLPATALIRQYRLRELSPVEVTDAVLDRIERLNPELGAFVTVTPELAREQALAAELAYAEGTAGMLSGVPVSIKDLSPTKGIRRFEALPVEARRYIARLEAVSGVRAALISTGSERDDTILRPEILPIADLRLQP